MIVRHGVKPHGSCATPSVADICSLAVRNDVASKPVATYSFTYRRQS